jgi:hypothetical protein
MRKIRVLVVVLIGLLMAGGLILAGCDSGCNNIGNVDCEWGPNGYGGYTLIKYCGKSKCAVYTGNSGSPLRRVTCDC